MPLPELEWAIIFGAIITLCVTLIGCLWRFASWKGGLDQWRTNIDSWIVELQTAVDVIKEDLTSIRYASEKDATKDGMVRRRSPLVPAKKL